jgi:hypothetical protein
MRMNVWCVVALAALGCQGSGEARAAAVAGIALPSGARMVAPPAVPDHGRAETQACVPDRGGADVAADVRATLARDWQDVQIVPTRAVTGRWVVVGRSGDQSVSGVVDEVRRGPCAEGEVFVRLGVNDIPKEPGPKTPGPSGVRAAAKGRLPTVLAPAKP